MKIIEAESAKPASVLGYRREKYFSATGVFVLGGKFIGKNRRFRSLYI
jgi:hypothetical protein